MKIRYFFIVAFVLSIAFNSLAAQQTTKKECPCCTKSHDAFDFWVGDWTVYNTDGNVVGTNLITKDEAYGNCVLREQWKSKGASRGTSYNYYNTTDNSWNQVWIDNSGFSLTLKGNRVDDKMILKSDLLEGKKGKYFNQITWQLHKNGSVTQIWNIIGEDGKIIQQAFKGIYKKTVK